MLPRARRQPVAFTLRELLVVLALIVVLSAILAVVLPAALREARAQRDKDQIRAIVQAMAIWCPGGPDSYPLPSRIEPSDIGPTIAGPAETKNTTGNILSNLINVGVIGPEQTVSPLETNPSIRICTTYAYDTPATAAIPTQALWDPAFSADFTRPEGGYVSYAHLQPVGLRRSRWSNTFSDKEAVFGTRGPEISAVQRTTDGSITSITLKKPSSNTLRFFGRSDSWKGHIGFNDGHVELRTSLHVPFHETSISRKTRPDVLFYDEPEDTRAENTYLGIFTKAGATPQDYQAIWD